MEVADLLEQIPITRGRPWRVTPLDGGMTNRNFRIDPIKSIDSVAPADPASPPDSYVLRIGGSGTDLLGIDRDAEVACARAAAELKLTPPIVAYLPEHQTTLRRFIPGRPFDAATLRQDENLRRVVELLRRYHDGPAGPGRFDVFQTVRDYRAKAVERGVAFPALLDAAWAEMNRLESELTGNDPLRPCHNDLLPANFIETEDGLQIIDWEYAGQGDRFFDLGNLAANAELEPDSEAKLVTLYFGHKNPVDECRLRGMRRMSDLREAMWGYLQAGVSQLPVDYLAYGQRHLERFLGARSVGR